MSFFGKNIKVIRKLNSYSQQEFGALFDLKRGTLGAYEEGRSEPKIDTIIKVANHFGLSIDLLLTKDFSDGELSSYLQNSEKGILVSSNCCIPCLGVHNLPSFFENHSNTSFLETLPSITLPYSIEGRLLGLIIDQSELLRHDMNFYPKDILIGKWTCIDHHTKIENETIAFALLQNELIFGRFEQIEESLILKGTQMLSADRVINYSEIIEFYKVRYLFQSRFQGEHSGVLDKLDFLQEQIEAIRKKVES